MKNEKLNSTVQIVDPSVAKREEDNERIKVLNADFRKRLATEELVTYKPPKFYKDILGTVYAFTFNNHDVVVRFDGTPQKFPRTVYDFLMKKLARILDGNTPVQKIDDL